MKAVKTTFLMGGAVLFKLLTGLIVVKLCATFVGVENYGITGQISSLVAIVTLLASGGVSTGLTKIFADNQYPAESHSQWWGTARNISLVASCSLIVIFFLARAEIENRVLTRSTYSTVIFIALVISILPIGLSGGYLGVLNGRQRNGLYASGMIIGSILGLGGFFVLSSSFKTPGALIGIVWIPVAQALAQIFVGFSLTPPVVKPANIDVAHRRTRIAFLSKFGLLSLSAGVTIPVVYIAVRLLVLKFNSSENLGIWQANVRLSEAYTQLPMLMLTVFYFPRFAKQSTRGINWNDAGRAYFFVAALMLSIAGFVYCARHQIVAVLFTSQFRSVSDFIALQLVGDFFRILAYVGTTILAARGRVKLCIFGELAQGALFAISSAVIIPAYGSAGPFLSYVLAYFLYFILTTGTLILLETRKNRSCGC
jgi:PST family polysaccharide transporter